MKETTPFFLISEETLQNNIRAFQNALGTYWPNSQLSYSIKTNSLPWLLKHLKNYKVMAEAVSDEEYQLAKKCGYSDNKIIFNGPIKGETQFELAVSNNALINLDSKADLKYLRKYAKGNGSNIGIRINIDPETFDKKDIGYVEDGFRFGFSDQTGELKKALDIYYSIWPSGKPGLHLHCNSVTRSLNVYRSIAAYASKLIHKYGLELTYIDMGGGFFGGVEGKPTPTDYIRVIYEELREAVDPYKTKLIVEPGSAIIGSAVDLYTTVLDIKDTKHARIVTTDGSRIHIDPLWGKSQYMFSVDSHQSVKKDKQIICGYTCMDHDRLMVLNNYQELNPGDKIIYHRVGSYSMTFGGMFIRYLPEVYVKKKNIITCVRKRISVDDYIKIYENSGE